VSKPRFVYLEQHCQFLSKAYKSMSLEDTTKAFNEKFGLNKTSIQIKSALKSRGIKSGRRPGDLRRGESKLFSPAEIAWIKSNYPSFSRKTLTIEFNEHFNREIKETQMIAFLKNNKIKSGRTGHFVKGQESWNAGTKGLIKPNSGSFKKGDKPHNWQPVGSERINSDGYHDVKIAEPNVWKAKHVILWEEHNGPVPPDHNVRFIDNDRNNVTLENLVLASKIEHLYMTKNKLSQHPEELRESVVLVSRIQAKTTKLSKD